MRADEVRLGIGVGIEERFLKAGDGRTRERLVRVVEQMPHILDQCATLFAEADDAIEKGLLTPTRFGPAISPPFPSAELIADGPGDEELVANIGQLKLVNILEPGDPEYISFEEACRRGSINPATNWGQRAAFALRDAGNAGKISEEIWSVGTYVVCPKTHWRGPGSGSVYAWYVIRNEDGFNCNYNWFGNNVNRNGQFASLATTSSWQAGLRR